VVEVVVGVGGGGGGGVTTFGKHVHCQMPFGTSHRTSNTSKHDRAICLIESHRAQKKIKKGTSRGSTSTAYAQRVALAQAPDPRLSTKRREQRTHATVDQDTTSSE